MLRHLLPPTAPKLTPAPLSLAPRALRPFVLPKRPVLSKSRWRRKRRLAPRVARFVRIATLTRRRVRRALQGADGLSPVTNAQVLRVV